MNLLMRNSTDTNTPRLSVISSYYNSYTCATEHNSKARKKVGRSHFLANEQFCIIAKFPAASSPTNKKYTNKIIIKSQPMSKMGKPNVPQIEITLPRWTAMERH